jgi:ribosomal-protein-alanine N-acetyltransferase
MATAKELKFGLRECKYDDIPSVMDVNESTLPENYPQFFYEQILEKYSEAFTVAYLVDDPDKIIGYIMWRVERGPSSFGLDYIKKGHLVSLAVLEQYRRQGIANGLLTRSMEIVKDFGVSEYVLEVRVSNAGAIRLYDKVFNYERIKILSQYYRDGEDAFYMAKKYDPTGKYQVGSTGITDQEILNYYDRQNNGSWCYACPECQQMLIKSPKYNYPGSIEPSNETILSCINCNAELLLFDIAQGKYDLIPRKK